MASWYQPPCTTSAMRTTAWGGKKRALTEVCQEGHTHFTSQSIGKEDESKQLWKIELFCANSVRTILNNPLWILPPFLVFLQSLQVPKVRRGLQVKTQVFLPLRLLCKINGFPELEQLFFSLRVGHTPCETGTCLFQLFPQLADCIHYNHWYFIHTAGAPIRGCSWKETPMEWQL